MATRATSISAGQWGYLGALNQALTTTSNVTFNNLTLTGNITSSGTTFMFGDAASASTSSIRGGLNDDTKPSRLEIIEDDGGSQYGARLDYLSNSNIFYMKTFAAAVETTAFSIARGSSTVAFAGAITLGANTDFGNYNITARNVNADTAGSYFANLRCNTLIGSPDTDHIIKLDVAADMMYFYPGDQPTDRYWIMWSADNTASYPVLYTYAVGGGRIGVPARWLHSISAYTIYYNSLSQVLDEYDDLALIDAIDAERDDKGDLIRDEWNNPKVDLNTIPPNMKEEKVIFLKL